MKYKIRCKQNIQHTANKIYNTLQTKYKVHCKLSLKGYRRPFIIAFMARFITSRSRIRRCGFTAKQTQNLLLVFRVFTS